MSGDLQQGCVPCPILLLHDYTQVCAVLRPLGVGEPLAASGCQRVSGVGAGVKDGEATGGVLVNKAAAIWRPERGKGYGPSAAAKIHRFPGHIASVQEWGSRK
ncbi:MAG: hypothetical protein HND44_10395 [Chloroflexi bacterium]|nr:hypothetical protein [Chloroflexota bacterium]